MAAAPDVYNTTLPHSPQHVAVVVHQPSSAATVRQQAAKMAVATGHTAAIPTVHRTQHITSYILHVYIVINPRTVSQYRSRLKIHYRYYYYCVTIVRTIIIYTPRQWSTEISKLIIIVRVFFLFSPNKFIRRDCIIALRVVVHLCFWTCFLYTRASTHQKFPTCDNGDRSWRRRHCTRRAVSTNTATPLTVTTLPLPLPVGHQGTSTRISYTSSNLDKQIS